MNNLRIKGISAIVLVGLWTGMVAYGSLDKDNDGLIDIDETSVFGTNPALPDSDGDKQSDLDEVIAGSDPLEMTNRFSFISAESAVAGTNNTMQVVFQTAEERIYSLLKTDSLSNNNWSVVQSNIVGNGASLMLVDTNAPGESQSFYRLQAIWPEGSLTASNDTYSVAESLPLEVDAASGVLANDSGNIGTLFLATLVTDPANGSVEFNTDGSFHYSPDVGFTGVDSFTYKISNGAGYSDSATVEITVGGTSGLVLRHIWRMGGYQVSALTDHPDYPYYPEIRELVNTLDVGTLYAKDYGVRLRGYIIPPATASDYVFSIDSDNRAEFWLSTDEDPLNKIKIAVQDQTTSAISLVAGQRYYVEVLHKVGTPLSPHFYVEWESATAGIAQGPIDSTYLQHFTDIPVAINDLYLADSNTLFEVGASSGILSNDNAGGQFQLSAVLESDVSNGTLNLQSSGAFSYLPDAGFTGQDIFTYSIVSTPYDSANTASVTIDVSYVEDVPLTTEDRFSLNQGETLSVAAPGVFGNDNEFDGQTLETILVTNALNGILILNSDGSFDYTPTNGYTGLDFFTYMASDGTTTSTPITVTLGVYDTNSLNGEIIREIWTGLGGINVSDLTSNSNYPHSPDIVQSLTSFDIPGHPEKNYGQRIRGYIQPPLTTWYKFDIHVSNRADLLLSSDDNPANAVKIQQHNTGSDAVYLERGKRYYVELINKVGNTLTSDASVTWHQLGRGPITSEVAIASEYVGDLASNGEALLDDKSFTLFADSVFNLNAPGVLEGSADNEGDALEAVLVNDVANGSLTLNSNGSFSYTPTPGFSGTDQFTFTANDGFSSNRNVATVNLRIVDGANPNVVLSSWNYDTSDPVSLAAASELSGWYALADRVNNRVEIRDIRGDLQAEITEQDIHELLPEMDLSGDYGICSLGFSSSARFLYIGVCGGPGSAGSKDAVLAFNTTVKRLTIFTRVDLVSTLTEPTSLGLLHYCGELFVGTESGLKVYTATRNIYEQEEPAWTLTPTGETAVTGLALDIYGEDMYLSTPDTLYRLDVYSPVDIDEEYNVNYLPKPVRSLQTVATGSDFASLTMGRSYGGKGNAGLYVHERVSSALSRLYHVGVDELRAGGNLSLNGYTEIYGDLWDIAGTPCGRMLLATPVPQIMADSSDTRMDFETWALFNYKQILICAKSQLAPNGAANLGTERGDSASSGGYSLEHGRIFAMADYVLESEGGEPDARDIAKMLADNALGLSTNAARLRNVDGLSSGSTNPANYETEKYSLVSGSQEIVGAMSLAHYYADDPQIGPAVNAYLRDHYRLADYVGVPGMTYKPCPYWGPSLGKYHWWQGESGPYTHFAAAIDPLWRNDYLEYVRTTPANTRLSSLVTWQGYENEIGQYLDYPGEQVLSSTYVVVYQMAQAFLKTGFYRDVPEWKQDFANHASKYAAWTDDHANPYFTIFNWGNGPIPGNPAVGYGNDNDSLVPEDENTPRAHRMDITDLGRLTDFCLYGDTWPAVAVYLAYREDRSIRMGPRAGYNNNYYEGHVVIDRFCRYEPTWFPARIKNKRWVGMEGILRDGVHDATEGIPDPFKPVPELSMDTNGNDRVDFSLYTPRRVLGSDDGINWTSYGFQYSPFTLDTGISHNQYQVIDPEGQHMTVVMTNTFFDLGLSGWSQQGDYTFSALTVPGESIAGTSAQIQVETGSASAEASLLQTIDLTEDFDLTKYVVYGNAALLTAGAPGQGYLRAVWDDDSNPANGALSTNESATVVDSANTRVEFSMDAQKPVGASHLHLAFVVEKSAAQVQRFVFDGLALIRLGAPVTGSNLDFETGDLTGWTTYNVTSGQIAATTDLGKVLEGTGALRISTTTADEPAYSDVDPVTFTASTQLDISTDPIGTRYIVRYKGRAVTQEATTVEMYSERSTASSTYRYIKSMVEPYFDGEEHVFTTRRGPGFETLDIVIDVKREVRETSSVDEIILDSFTIHKEPAWPRANRSLPVPVE
jgi:hypothetical protein